MNEDLLRIWKDEMELGTRCLGNQQYQQAEKYFVRSCEIAEESLVPEMIAFSVRLLATTRLRLGKHKMAENGFREALGICQKINNAKGMSEAWAGLASVAVLGEEWDSARENFEKAIAVYPDASPPLRLGILYSDLGQVYGNLKLWHRAQSAYDKAVELCVVHDYPRGEAEIYVLKGELYYRRGEMNQALEQIKRACRIFSKLAEWEDMANSLQYLAFIYFEQGDIDCSLVYQQRALALGLRTKEKEENSESSYFLSKIIQDLGGFYEAEYYLKLSIELYPKKDTGLASRYQSLGGMDALKADFIAAKRHYLQAIGCAQDERKLNELYEALAVVVERQRQEGEALPYQEKFDCTGSKSEILALSGFKKLGAIYEDKHDELLALQYYWKALELARIFADSQIPLLEENIQKLSRKVRERKRSKGVRK